MCRWRALAGHQCAGIGVISAMCPHLTSIVWARNWNYYWLHRSASGTSCVCKCANVNNSWRWWACQCYNHWYNHWPCLGCTWTECAFLTWFGNQTLGRVQLPLHIVSAGLSLRAGQALSCYWQFDLQLATITVPSCLTVTAERRNAKQYKTHIKASEITNDHKNKTLYIAATKRNWDIGHFQWEGKVPNSSEVTIPWVLLRPCSAPRPLYSNTNCCKVHYIFCGQKSYYWEYKLMHCIMYCLNIFNRVVCSIAFGTITCCVCKEWIICIVVLRRLMWIQDSANLSAICIVQCSNVKCAVLQCAVC